MCVSNLNTVNTPEIDFSGHLAPLSVLFDSDKIVFRNTFIIFIYTSTHVCMSKLVYEVSIYAQVPFLFGP